MHAAVNTDFEIFCIKFVYYFFRPNRYSMIFTAGAQNCSIIIFKKSLRTTTGGGTACQTNTGTTQNRSTCLFCVQVATGPSEIEALPFFCFFILEEIQTT